MLMFWSLQVMTRFGISYCSARRGLMLNILNASSVMFLIWRSVRYTVMTNVRTWDKYRTYWRTPAVYLDTNLGILELLFDTCLIPLSSKVLVDITSLCHKTTYTVFWVELSVTAKELRWFVSGKSTKYHHYHSCMGSCVKGVIHFQLRVVVVVAAGGLPLLPPPSLVLSPVTTCWWSSSLIIRFDNYFFISCYELNSVVSKTLISGKSDTIIWMTLTLSSS